MKILILSNSAAPLIGLRLELIRELIAQGHELRVVFPDPKREDYRKTFSDLDVRVESIPMSRRGTNPFRDYRLYRNYRALIKRTRPDKVLTYTIKCNVYGGYAARKLKTSYCANITGLGSAFHHSGLLRRVAVALNKRALKRAEVVFFENEENARIMKEFKIVRDEQICVLRGAGVNLETYAFRPMEGETAKFCFVGRVMKEKGVEELFDVAERLRQENADATFDFFGPFEEDYRGRIEELAQKGAIRYHGEVGDLAERYARYDCVVLPSYHEGMANVLLEGAATGRALIASDIPGCREAALDGVSGFLCEPRNRESLYRAIRCFIDLSVPARAAMGAAGRAHMERSFDRAQVVRETIGAIFGKGERHD